MRLLYAQTLYTNPRLMSYIVSACPVLAAAVVVFAPSQQFLYNAGILVASIMIPYYIMSHIRIIIIIGNILRIKDDDFTIFFSVLFSCFRWKTRKDIRGTSMSTKSNRNTDIFSDEFDEHISLYMAPLSKSSKSMKDCKNNTSDNAQTVHNVSTAIDSKDDCDNIVDDLNVENSSADNIIV